ncbi:MULTISPECIES: acyltransferase family protein [Mesorhizobium]|uniref:Acyltransferase n=1 Tax=Mesorhizobium denitrificans TaxID=2294114 RepID=A0A371X962_9HYPH|nr:MULTISPECIES: acyltransferase [Mesorhizobium]RFC65753.1 acyltransferase [Mesorhizobium denitrificans]
MSMGGGNMQEAARAGAPRLTVLDGLRGWAALCVTCSHIFWGIFGDVVPLFKNVATGVFLNGLFSVMLFFVISGEALTAAYWAKPERRAIWKLAVKRYPRLAIPVSVACVIVALLIAVGLVYNRQAGELIGNTWLREFPTETKTIGETVSFALFYVFYKPFIDFSIIPFLWTMRTEAIGSIVVVLFLLCERFISQKKTVLAILAFIAIATGTLSGCFFVGMLFALMRREGLFDWHGQSHANTALAIAAIIVLLIPPSYLMLQHHELPPLLMLVAAVCCLLIYSDVHISAFLSNSLSQWLGKISFPLFLMHYAVIVTFTSWAIVQTSLDSLAPQPVYAGIALTSLALAMACAMLFVPVEQFAIRFSHATWRLFEKYILDPKLPAPSAPA